MRTPALKNWFRSDWLRMGSAPSRRRIVVGLGDQPTEVGWPRRNVQVSIGLAFVIPV